MSTETTTPASAPDLALADAQRRADEAIAAAEEAKRRYEDLSAKATTLAATPAPQAPAPDTGLATELAALKARLATLDTIEARAKRDLEEERVRHVRQMGLNVPLSDDELLRLVPDADPRVPEGRAKIEEWRNSRPVGFFAPKGPSAEAVRAQQQPRIDALKAKNTRLINPDVAYQRRAKG
jgi:hypothetical protein